MTQTRNRVWIDVVAALVTLAIGGVMLYALLPAVTAPGQQVVPPLPASTADTAQSLLTIFIVMTAIGAPVTIGIVLALVLKLTSPRVPASSTVAPDLSGVKAPAKAQAGAPQEMSPRAARLWKVLAAILVLVVAALGLGWFASMFAQLYR